MIPTRAPSHAPFTVMDKDARKKALPRFDGRLRDAVTDDMAAYVGEVTS